MKKIIIIAIILVVLGVAYWLASPLFINKKVSEQLPVNQEQVKTDDNKAEAVVLKTGKVVGQAGHRGEGTISLVKVGTDYYVRMEEDFNIINGPDLFVHLGSNGQYNPQLVLGELKGNIGSQNYLVSDPGALETNNEVWVWCRAFSVPFIKAELK